ncbi:hypothetical protein HQ602_03975 [Rhodococcus kroppenstedtii]|uniref:hypothetical protein n=1 Tax=Rhodococcoides kroppenstedtii TaxID=293050 RepID=UPI001C9B1704|nr:hypothetical protein [Rhodococcus kroppenstedtii]MBY6435535.1 hypothetical protein [Rhodococcus kroppenstedtii]
MAGILRDGGAKVDVAVVTAIVACGILAAGLTHHLQSDTVAIPGCSEVIPEDELERVNFAFSGSGFAGGGDFGAVPNPDATLPWATPAGAEAMTSALASALPPGTVRTTNNFGSDLRFLPLTLTAFGSNTSARGSIYSDGRSGWLTVEVAYTGGSAGPCFAGQVDERISRPDGTVLDVRQHGDVRRVTVHAPGGFQVDVNADGVLTLDQVIDIASTPAFRVAAAR